MKTEGSGRIPPILDAVQASVPGTPQVKSDKVHLDATIDWICHSQDISPDGGSAATYNLFLGWEDPYPETTGYLIPTLFAYADRYDDTERRARALDMAEWTLSTQHEQGSFPGGTGTEGEPNAFNTGQIVLGLATAAERTGDDRFRTAVRDACDWLVEAQSSTGHWAARDYNSCPHVYTSRVAWALLVGESLLDEDVPEYRKAARRNLEWVVDNQRSNGWFEQAGFDADGTPFLHTIAYTIRGLLEGGRLLDDDEIYESGKQTADILLDRQSAEGVLKGEFDKRWSDSWYHCLTGNAQMAVIWAKLFERTGEVQYESAARTAVQFLKRHQPLDATDDVRGGLPGSYPLFGKYIFFRYPNWAAKFFADALLALDTDRDRPLDRGGTGESELSDGPLRLCLLVDGEHIYRWVAEALEELIAETETEISLVVVNEDSGTLGSGNVKRGRKYPAYAAFRVLLSQLDDGSPPTYKDDIHLSEIPTVEDSDIIRTYPDEVDGLWNRLPSEVVDRIAATSDLVFRRGFGLIEGDILTATEYGVLSYHHGDPRKYRGGPAGFWEFMRDEETAGMMVQSLRDELDAGVVQSYAEVDIDDCRSWGAVRERLYTNSTDLLTEAVENIRSEESEPMYVDDLGPVYNPPSTVELAQFFAKSALERW